MQSPGLQGGLSSGTFQNSFVINRLKLISPLPVYNTYTRHRMPTRNNNSDNAHRALGMRGQCPSLAWVAGGRVLELIDLFESAFSSTKLQLHVHEVGLVTSVSLLTGWP